MQNTSNILFYLCLNLIFMKSDTETLNNVHQTMSVALSQYEKY